MPVVSVGGKLRVIVSTQVNRAPLAITSDGELVLNLAQFDITKTIDGLVAHAKD